jgi:hypothetical protein
MSSTSAMFMYTLSKEKNERNRQTERSSSKWKNNILTDFKYGWGTRQGFTWVSKGTSAGFREDRT